MSAAKIQKFAAISKIQDNEDGTITVFGVASTEAVDAHGEIVTKSAMANALPDYFKYGTGNLRSMHQPIAAGVVNKAAVNEETGETEIEAVVVDPTEVLKVKTGVYKGFSIGANHVPGGYDKVTKTISALQLVEISLVDRPANPEAVISMWKFEDPVVTVTPEQAAAVDQLAELLNKGDISPDRLVELARAELAKGAEPTTEPVVEPAPAVAAGAVSIVAADGTTVLVTEPVVKSDEGAIKKSMYSVSRFADLIQSLGWLVSDLQCEADWEGDDSPVPEKLRSWLTAGAVLFQELAAEEVAEFVAQYAPPAPVVATVQLSEQASEIRKSLTAAASSGLAAYLAIGKAHMPEDDLARAVLADGFEKATESVLARLVPESDAITKLADANATITKLAAERDELAAKVAKFDAAPAKSNAVLRVVVAKGTDGTGVTESTASAAIVETVKKADGSVDHEATALAAIKKVHQSGGLALRSLT
jgi:hypothetical protein